MARSTSVPYDEQLLRAPRLRTVPLPAAPPPFFIRACLAIANNDNNVAHHHPRANALGVVDFNLPLTLALAALSADEASRPATSPPTSVLRIVHPLFPIASSFLVIPANGNTVTVYDVLSTVHAILASPVPASALATLSTFNQQEAHLAAQEREGRLHATVRFIDLLDGATRFAGLQQDEAQARRYVAPGVLGIDAHQAITWILHTVDPPAPSVPQTMGLGPYQRW
ncbi:hypothetical protein FRC17_004199 [Serendipita sp. 399]|nr:hypothetical protein FRC17_004199 [Serendipita sp. 399]